MFPFTRSECPAWLVDCWENMGIRFRDAKTRNPAYQFHWYKKFNQPESLRLLLEMTNYHCAFCDGGFLGAESRKTIEHFRPKSLYQTLAFQWENLYPCCDQCQSAKGERFDEQLLVGDLPDYYFERYFCLDYVSGALLPNPLASEEDQQRAAVTLRIYGLNLYERKRARIFQRRLYECRTADMELDDFSYRYFLMDA